MEEINRQTEDGKLSGLPLTIFDSMISRDDFFMQRCLDLAGNGLGRVAPNPLVGAVIVHNDRIIGEGFHTAYGKPHAEVEAISRVSDPALLPESTLYVSLEPCNHYGQTPPCTDLILKKGIRRVVIAQCDPNPVAAGGIDRLRKQGVEVITGVLEAESRWLNRRFNRFHEDGRPWLILKWAQTMDGFVDSKRQNPQDQKPAWITDETCRRLVHKWRTEEQSILAGSKTILADNPMLNVRAWSGPDPVRVTIDRQGILTDSGDGADSLRPRFHFLDGTIPSLVYSNKVHPSRQNCEYVPLTADQPVWSQVLSDLHRRKIQSVLVEGGPTLLRSLISADLWDEARIFIGPDWYGAGVPAPAFPIPPSVSQRVGNSQLFHFFRP